MSCDQFDREAVRLHVELIHQLAETFTGQGKLVVASYGENPTTGEALIPKVEHFEVGATEAMTAAIVRLSREPHRNVYVPLAVVRKSLARGKKGEEADVIGVLGTVGDFDDDAADQYEKRLPLPPCYALESSANRYQTFNLYDRPAAVTQAKPVAMRLKAFAKCDHGTVDMSHVWRVPGTLNWPNAKKAKDGRPLDPQLVKVARPWNGARTTLAELAAVLPEPEQSDATVDETTEPHTNGADISVELLVRQLPPKLRKRITEPCRADRSKTLFSVVKELGARGFDHAMIARVIRAYPNSIGAKHANRNDLDQDVARILAKRSQKRESWQDELIQGDGNTPRSNLANAIIALQRAPEWQGVLGYDVFGEKVVIRAKAPWMTSPPPRPIAWNDVDEIRLANWLQHQYIFVTPRTAGQAASVVAHDSEFHPVRDYLASLTWDGTSRLDNWLVRYLGVHSDDPPEDDNEMEDWKKVHRYVETVGPKFMIACVARVEEPGCQADYALILEGPQGQRKSTAIRALVPHSNWFTDEISDLGTKDAALQLAGRWLIEWSESTA